MDYVLTFVAAQHYKELEKIAREAVDEHSLQISGLEILSQNKALDIFFISDAAPDITAIQASITGNIDIFIQEHAPALRRKSLLLSDMDATIVAEETLDELAAALNLKDKIADITAATMRGELNFEDSVKKRVAMLEGLPLSALEDTAKTLHYSRGAKSLIQTLNAHNVTTILVSGGFTFFTKHVSEHIGFKENFGNTLGIDGSRLSGEVIPPILGKSYKAQLLQEKASAYNIPLAQCACIGDGANDAAMLTLAQNHKGLGVGYHPKPVLKQQLNNNIVYGSLTSLLYAQGYKEDEIIHEPECH